MNHICQVIKQEETISMSFQNANKRLGLNFSIEKSLYSKLTIEMRKNPALACEINGNDENDTSVI